CSMQEDCVIDNLDVELLYEAPLMLEKNNFSAIVSRELGLDSVSPNLKEWEKMVSKARGRKSTLTIGLVGQCVEQYDAYLSVSEALTHAGISHGAKIDLRWISGISLNSGNIKEKFKGLHGVIVPDGFGVKGSEGLVEAAKYARENKLPFFGIGLGMQSMAIAFTRQIIGFENVSTREFDHTCAQQLFEIPTLLGGSTRLGAHECALVKGTKIQKAYKKDIIRERHRHRLEFNNLYREPLKKEGMIFSAFSNNGQFVESIELDEKFFHLGVQFRPEFLSRPHKPHPLFLSFIEASIK
ncbi:MAG: gamma-glutamyl-gamma-aminobutyrate hydrolase family protein, partial [Firmicutes bacterium]|nr:gamma-glutamyl-gamma-aminobutyrate hydrolase family protein [Bacillota bacterium]